VDIIYPISLSLRSDYSNGVMVFGDRGGLFNHFCWLVAYQWLQILPEWLYQGEELSIATRYGSVVFIEGLM
jgi:hypothetical protein